MKYDIGRARKEADLVRAAAPWRHPSRLSAIVWLYLGSGSERVWVGGELVGSPAGDDPETHDFPYRPPAEPVRGKPAESVIFVLDGLMVSPRDIVAGLYSRDFALPDDMPALRMPYEVNPSHLAGILVACHVMLACGPLLLDPAGARRGDCRRRLAAALQMASNAVAERSLAGPVLQAARLLTEGMADKDGAAARFADPAMSEE